MDWSGMDYFWFLWCFYQPFGLSFWRHPSTTEDNLVSKWSNAKFLQIFSGEETNPSISWMTWGWVILSKLSVWVNYSFNKFKTYKQLKSAETNLPHLNHDIWSFWATEIWLSVCKFPQLYLHLHWNSCELSEMMNLAINYSDKDIYYGMIINTGWIVFLPSWLINTSPLCSLEG